MAEYLHGEDTWSAIPSKSREGDQRLPDGAGECVQDRVIAEMQESKKVGLQRYGSTLKTFNGRRGVQDIQEEARDLFIYLTQLRMESETNRDVIIRLVAEEIIEHFVRGGEDYDNTVVLIFAKDVVDRIYGHFATQIVQLVAEKSR
jgi:hypothetical protein